MDNIMDNSVSGAMGVPSNQPASGNPNVGVNVMPKINPPTLGPAPAAAPAPIAAPQPASDALQDNPTPPPEAEKDPFAAFNPQPLPKTGKDDPFAAFNPVAAPSATQQNGSAQPDSHDLAGQLRQWASKPAPEGTEYGDVLPYLYKKNADGSRGEQETPALDEGLNVVNPKTGGVYGSNMLRIMATGLADIFDAMKGKGPRDEMGAPIMTPAAETILTMIGPKSPAMGTGKLIASDAAREAQVARGADTGIAAPGGATVHANDTLMDAAAGNLPTTDEAMQAMGQGPKKPDNVNKPNPFAAQPQATTPVQVAAAEEAATNTAKGMKARASDKYNNLPNTDVVLDAAGTTQLFKDLRGEPAPTAVGRQAQKDSLLTQFVDKWEPVTKDGPLTLGDATILDKELGDQISAEYGKGGLSAKGEELREAQQTLRKSIADSPAAQAKADANKDWQQAAKLRDIENIESRADGKPNEATAIQTYLSTYRNNPKNMRGWSPDELKALDEASKSGVLTNLLKAVGNKLSVPAAALAEGMTGGITAGAAAGLAAHTVTSGAKMGAASIQRGKVQTLKNILGGGGKKAPGILSRAGSKAAGAAKGVGNAIKNAPETAGGLLDSALTNTPRLAPNLAGEANTDDEDNK